MCEQTPVEYKNGDIVWVKLGSCWWPGEVEDLKNISEDTLATFKKPLIAAVKFFDEDYYEFIKSLDKIYFYNCSKKNEFIKKGLDLHRAKHDYMKKFPEDVSKAETKTNGNPNIIDDPMFAPEKKTNIAALIFGTPKQKKSPKKSIGTAKKSVGSKSATSTPKSSASKVVTHPRFLGQDDHEIRILVQTPGETTQKIDDESISYKCAACGFSTERIDVSIIHHKSHIQGDYTTPLTSPRKNKRPYVKKNKKVVKMTKSKTSSIIEDLDLIDKGMFFQTESSDNDTLGSSCDSEPEAKRRKRRGKRKAVSKKDDEKKPHTVVDIRGDLLAEWDDESDAEQEESMDSTNIDTNPTANEKVNHKAKTEKPKVDSDTKKDDKSCFDFEEDEENQIVETSVGRKIPRVIPPADKSKNSDDTENNSDLSESNAESNQNSSVLSENTDDISNQENVVVEHVTAETEKSETISEERNQNELLQTSTGEKENEKKQVNEEEDVAFRDILEATTVPDLPEIPHSLKYEQNFHDSKKIKFPDKTNENSIQLNKDDTRTEIKESEVINKDIKEPDQVKPEVKEPETPKLINPKKRFVKSFEDFELQIYNEQRKLLELEQSEKRQETVKPQEDLNTVIANKNIEEKKTSPPTVVEVSKLKTQLMFKLGSVETRSRKDKVLTPQDEFEDFYVHSNLPKKFKSSDVRTSKDVLNEIGSISTQKMCELPEELLETSGNLNVGNSEENDLLPIKVLECEDSVERENSDKFSILSPVPTEVPYIIEKQDSNDDKFSNPEKDKSYNFKRRFSLKMSEINETKPMEIKEVTELLELDENVKLDEVTRVLQEDKGVADSMDMLETEHIIATSTDVLETVNVQNDKHNLNILSEESAEEPFIKSVAGQNLVLEEAMNISTFEDNQPKTMCKDKQLNANESVNSCTMPEPNISFSCTSAETQNTEDLSALTTLAAVSELTTNLEMHCTSTSEKSKIIESNLTSCVDVRDKSNLNFVTMDDLAEGQVEISDSAISKVKSKPMTLASFSVDFQESTDSSQNEGVSSSALVQQMQSTNQPDLIEMSLGKVFEGENDSNLSKMIKSDSSDHLDGYDAEEQIPSMLMCGAKPHPKKFKTKIVLDKAKPEFSSSSKLLEILTDSKTKPLCTTDALQRSPTLNTMITEGKGNILQKDSSSGKSMLKSKEDKLLNVLRDSSIAKVLSKAKEEPAAKESTISKMLSKSKDEKLYTITKESPISKSLPKFEGKNSKFVLKSSPALKSFTPTTPTKSTKPIILSEKIIKTLSETTESVSVQKVTSKRNTQDVEDIDTYIIQKPPKKVMLHEEQELENLPKKNVISKGKAKILQQTIIKPSGDVIQPAASSVDDSIFDINSMPIVLGDQLLTTDGIENMPVVLSEMHEPSVAKTQSEQRLILNKTVTTQPVMLKTYSSHKMGKSRIYQAATSTTKILKSNPAVISRPGKQDKYIILPTSTSATTSKYTVGKKQNATKRMTPVILPTSNISPKVQNTSTSEPTGNKIMIVTNQQGQQSRVLLTPAQQKLFGYQSAGSKLVKSTLKGNILQKTNTKSSILSTISSVSPKVSNAQDPMVTSNAMISTDPVLMPIKTTTPLRSIKAMPQKAGKLQVQPQKISLQDSLSTFKGQQKTIVIKNQQGQVVKKFHGTDDAFLEQQVAEQVQAIKASSGSFSSLNKIKPPLKRSYKKPEAQKNLKLLTGASKILKNEAVPPLAPISPKRTDSLMLPSSALKAAETKVDATKPESTQQKPLNQLIIQDALGNQTTIMEGQILALPSGETIDGQPQSYMLVTLDESGNLTPLNNEALLSLDPNLSLGGDLSNMVLQLEDGANKKSTATPTSKNENLDSFKPQESPQIPKEETVMETPKLNEPVPAVEPQNVQTVTCSIGNDPNQQLIITGDPISTQKFIESLAEGNPDLANLLANAEGNILIQTDEQQILINTDSENQVLLPLNSGVAESNESDSNPIFSTQPLKNQDILAAALADTDVFQQEQTVSPVHNKLMQAQLSPNSGLYQAGVSNVLETTLSLSSPIMTPLEVPSSNNKKIPDEEMDILTTEVPKNVDLPITITDPNISQTVAQQQVVSLITGELTTNLELPLTIAEQNIAPLTSAEMNSPSFGYPLSTLDESVDVQKSFSGPISMPLLTEDPQDAIVEESEIPPEQIIEDKHQESITLQSPTGKAFDDRASSTEERPGHLVKKDLFESSALTDSIIKDDAKSPSKSFLGTTIETEEGLCTLGGAMCSSLSEPPPDMFDLSLVSSHFVTDNEMKSSVSSSIRSTESSVNEPDDGISQIDSTNELSESNDAFNKFESYEVENKIENSSVLNAPQSSNSSSPVNVDENSCEIPVQPQIVTDLPSPSYECMEVDDFESNKRVDSDFDTESDKKIEFD